ncbi:MAG: ferrous iron transport protein A [Thermovirgaceae bacterium]
MLTCSLHECPARTRVRVLTINGGRSLQQRCSDLGLVPGAEIEVQMNYGGRMQIRSRGTSYAVGGGMAEKIVVSKD